MRRTGNYAFELSTPKQYDLYGLVVEHETLLNTASVRGVALNWRELNEHGRLSIPSLLLLSPSLLLLSPPPSCNSPPHHANSAPRKGRS